MTKKQPEIARLFAQPETLSHLEIIEAKCFGGERWNKKMLSDTLNSGICRAYGILEGDEICAYMIYSAAEDISELLTLASLPGARRKGYAAALLQLWQENCKKEGVDKLFLEVNTKNDAATALYKKFEFKQSGRRNNYYINSEYETNDAFIFTKVLKI